MKKLLSAVLVIFLFAGSLCGFADAEEVLCSHPSQTPMLAGLDMEDRYIYVKASDMKKVPARKGPSRSRSSENIYEFIERQYREKAETITLLPVYPIEVYVEYDEDNDAYYVDLENFWQYICAVLYSNYDILAYTSATFVIVYDEDNDAYYVESFSPRYINPEEGDEAAVEMMDTEIAKYISAVSEIPNDDVVGKMLVIHDLFCHNNTYAQEELEPEESGETEPEEEESAEELLEAEEDEEEEEDPEEEYEDPEFDAEGNQAVKDRNNYTAYGLFKNNRAVCQGNSMALKAIYDALNEQLKEDTGAQDDIIKTGFCVSYRINHIWNVVKIDGEWYHIDETWDDPPETDTGYARHNNFLRPYSHMSNHIREDGIVDWIYYADETVVCSDDKYLGSYIFNVFPTAMQMTGYENGRYKIEFESIEIPFWSDSIKSERTIATDPYDEVYLGETYNAIKIFAQEQISVTSYHLAKDTDGGIKSLGKGNKIKDVNTTGTFRFPKSQEPSQAFFWVTGSMEPLCHVIDIPAEVE